MLKAVIFDLDNTLYDYDAAHAVAWQTLRVFATGALRVTPEEFDALHAAADRTLRERTGGGCAAIHNRLLRYQALLELSHGPVGLAPEMAKLYWTALLAAMRLSPGAREALVALKGMGLVTGVCTNMTADYQFEKLNRLGIMPLIDFIVTSEEVSAEKPEQRIFDACAKKAGCANGECAFVGDQLKGDILGALGAGMKAIWYCPRGEAEAPEGATVIASLEALPGLIASIRPEGGVRP